MISLPRSAVKNTGPEQRGVTSPERVNHGDHQQDRDD
jgi:hypothetical protein